MKLAKLRIRGLQWILLLSLFLFVPASADDVVLTTTVPAEHTLSLVMEGSGQAACCGMTLENGASVTLPRQSEPVLDLLPADGCRVASLLYNGTDFSGSMTGLRITLPPLTADSVLRIEFRPAAESEEIRPQLTLQQKYLAMTPGKRITLSWQCVPESYADRVTWSALTTDMSEASDVITVDAAGTVTACRKGTAYASAVLTVNGSTETVRCRIDVSEEGTTPIAAETLKLTLGEKKGTTELFRTDYTKITLLPELAQNRLTAELAEEDTGRIEARELGAALESARFTDPTTASLFDLRAADDRTLEIVPTQEAILLGSSSPKSIKNSYKSAICVQLDGKEFETEVYTLTVKKSVPKLKAAELKFNSAAAGDLQTLQFTGGTVKRAERKAGTALPAFLAEIDEQALTVRLTAENPPAKASGNLQLTCSVEGWAIPAEVKVKVSVKKTLPKLSYSAKSITLLAGSLDYAELEASAAPVLFRDTEAYPLTFVCVKEGKNIVQTQEAGEILTCSHEGSRIRVSAAQTDTKTHSYQVIYSVFGQEASFKVTVTGKAAQLKLKTSGSIDTAVKNSSITVKAALSGFHIGSGESYSVRVWQKTKGQTDRNVTDLFTVNRSGAGVFVLQEKESGTLPGGSSYTVEVGVDTDGDGSADAVNSAKLSVKWSSPAKVPVSITLKASGAIDVIRPGSAVTLTPTIKNYYGYVLQTSDLTFYKKIGSAWQPAADAPFAVAIAGNSFTLTARPGLRPADQYAVGMTAVINGTEYSSGGAKKTPTAIKVKMGTAKLALSASSGVMQLSDAYSQSEFRISVKDSSVASVKSVSLDSKSAAYFRLIRLSDDSYALAFKNDRIPTGLKAGKTMSVKLSVTLTGSETGKANNTLTYKVLLK